MAVSIASLSTEREIALDWGEGVSADPRGDENIIVVPKAMSSVDLAPQPQPKEGSGSHKQSPDACVDNRTWIDEVRDRRTPGDCCAHKLGVKIHG